MGTRAFEENLPLSDTPALFAGAPMWTHRNVRAAEPRRSGRGVRLGRMIDEGPGSNPRARVRTAITGKISHNRHAKARWHDPYRVTRVAKMGHDIDTTSMSVDEDIPLGSAYLVEGVHRFHLVRGGHVEEV